MENVAEELKISYNNVRKTLTCAVRARFASKKDLIVPMSSQ